MDWNQSKVGYYADFVLVPLLVLAAALLSFHHGGIFAAEAAAGLALWTFLEYWIHRTLFHVVLRPAHWLHHKRARDYIAAPFSLTAIFHAAALGLAFAAGTLGLFAGIELGYLAYIVVHDRIHHTHTKPTGWLRRRWMLHMMHHNGAEANFGVVTSLWDYAFGTHWLPKVVEGRSRGT